MAAEMDVPIGVDEARGIELFQSPQRPADAVGPEQHVSMASAELHGHPDSCCCHATCAYPGCHVPGAAERGEWMDEDEDPDDGGCQHEWELRSEHDLWVCAWCQAETTAPVTSPAGGDA